MSIISDAVANATTYLTEHPEEARYRDSAAKALLGDGLRVSVTGAAGETLDTDMPRGIGGGAAAPSPGWYFRAAAAACVASLIGIRAAALGLDIPAGTLEVTVDSESDDRGILGLDEAVPAGALELRVVVHVEKAFTDVQMFESIVRWAVDHCPVTDSAQRAVPIDVQID